MKTRSENGSRQEQVLQLLEKLESQRLDLLPQQSSTRSRLRRKARRYKRLAQHYKGLVEREKAARQEAEASNTAKDRILALVCHELRTPLNAILAWAQLLQTGSAHESEVPEAAERIIRSGQAQAKLIGDILDLSRSVNGNFVLDRHPLALSGVVRSAIETVDLTAQEKSVHIHLSLDTSEDRVLGDARRLEQVILNLLTNALKFTPGGGQVFVVLGRHQDQVRLRVRDTGSGIAPELLPCVFDRFVQRSAGEHGGLGLGLALVRSLVEAHGGCVAVESPGKGLGATFTVTLPAI